MKLKYKSLWFTWKNLWERDREHFGILCIVVMDVFVCLLGCPSISSFSKTINNPSYSSHIIPNARSNAKILQQKYNFVKTKALQTTKDDIALKMDAQVSWLHLDIYELGSFRLY